MKPWIWSALSLLVGCSTVPDGTTREIRVGAVERTVKWHTSASTVPAPQFDRGELVSAPTLDKVALPAAHIFVPVCCSAIPWFENIPILGDDGKPEGTLHADGITRVLKPFPGGQTDSRLCFSGAPQTIVGGFGDENADPTQPWRMFSIYLFAVPDSLQNRRIVKDAKSLEDIFRFCDFVVEVHTDELKRG